MCLRPDQDSALQSALSHVEEGYGGTLNSSEDNAKGIVLAVYRFWLEGTAR
jgi:hypothetical protein